VIPETIDSRIWPRTAAIAERFWSPAADRDADDMYRRLAAETVRLEAAGLMQVSGPARMQRQIAGTTQIGPLELFADTLQPVDFGVRGQEQAPSTLTVFDRLADGARPDPPLRHQLTLLVHGAIHGEAGDRQHLQSIFQSWIDAAPALNRLEADSPLLQEVSGHIAVFPKLGTMGVDALSYIAAGKRAPGDWQTAQMAILSGANKPKELVDYVVLDPLKELVAAAAEGVEMDVIQSYMQPLVNNGTMAGTVTLVATKDGTVYLKATGYRDLDARSPMPTDAMFWIASVSKPLTATALMMLVDEGKIKLDYPVEKYLPEFKGQKVEMKQEAGGEQKLVKASHPIRVREILSHTSGLRFRSAAQPGALDLMTLKDQVRSFAAETLVYQPGTDYLYSNEGLNTAARIIEVVSGMPYEQFMQERLFNPLGMKDTTFWPDGEQIGRLAGSYKLDAESKGLVEMPIDQLTYPLDDRQHRFPMPAGGLFSTASDLEKFCQMILNGGSLDGKRYISAASLHAMTSSENRGLGKTDYGFGWTIGARGFGHGGAYKNAIDIDTTTGRILVFMVQQAGAWGTADGDAMLPRLKELANTMVAGQGPH
jgi:CubicO group peptidase (beta-lactamase class C family)